MTFEVGDTVLCPLPPRVGVNDIYDNTAVIIGIKDNSLIVKTGSNNIKEIAMSDNITILATPKSIIKSVTEKGVDICSRAT